MGRNQQTSNRNTSGTNSNTQKGDTNQDTSSIPSPTTVFSKDYYCEGGDLRISVGDIEFRLHSTFFRRGKTFFSSFVPPGQTLDPKALPGTVLGSIIIRNATVKEFENFAYMFYNPSIDDYSSLTLSDWFGIYRLSKEWGFDCVRKTALRYIKQKEDKELPDLLDRIVCYESYDLPLDIMYPLYEQLCTRDERPSKEEREKLGDDKVICVLNARDELYKASKNGKLTGASAAQTKKIIMKELGLSDEQVLSTSTSDGLSALSTFGSTNGGTTSSSNTNTNASSINTGARPNGTGPAGTPYSHASAFGRI